MLSIAQSRLPYHVMLALLSAALVAGCTSESPSSPTPMPPATSAQEFGVATCSSLTAMSRAIGNPDTASDSILSAALDDAIRIGDQARVDEAAARMQAELVSARAYARVAAGWPPGATTGATLDRLMVAFQAFVEAKRATAVQGLAAADTAAQSALADSGGIEAWQALIRAGAGIPAEVAATLADCRFWEAGAPSPDASVMPVPPNG